MITCLYQLVCPLDLHSDPILFLLCFEYFTSYFLYLSILSLTSAPSQLSINGNSSLNSKYCKYITNSEKISLKQTKRGFYDFLCLIIYTPHTKILSQQGNLNFASTKNEARRREIVKRCFMSRLMIFMLILMVISSRLKSTSQISRLQIQKSEQIKLSNTIMFSLIKPTNHISMNQIDRGVSEVSSQTNSLIHQQTTKYNELRDKLNLSCNISPEDFKQNIEICEQFMMITEFFIEQVDQSLKINLNSRWKSPLALESVTLRYLSQEKMVIGIDIVLSILNLASQDHDQDHPFLFEKLDKAKNLLSMIEKSEYIELPFFELKALALTLLQKLSEAIIDNIHSEQEEQATEKVIKVSSAYENFRNCMNFIQNHEEDLSELIIAAKSKIQTQFQFCRAKFYYYEGKQFESEGKVAKAEDFYWRCLHGCQQLEKRFSGFSGKVKFMSNQCRKFLNERSKQEKYSFESTTSQLLSNLNAPLTQSRQKEPKKLRSSTSMILDDDDNVMLQESIGSCKKDTLSTPSLLPEDNESVRLMKQQSNQNEGQSNDITEEKYCQCSFQCQLL